MASVFSCLFTIAILYFFVPESGKETIVQAKAVPAYAANYQGSSATQGPAFDFTAAAEKVTPAVVHVTSTEQAHGQDQAQMPDSMDQQQLPEFFRYFFKDMPQGQQPQEQGPMVGEGSGVIISADGYIVTNNHVVADADKLDVLLPDNRSFKATVIGTDPDADIALIKIDAKDLPYLPFSNSKNVKVGQWVLAVGNPFGTLNSTVTAGIVSATGRNINLLDNQDKTAVESFIQTDAAINPGNSGGALVDADGNLIGINTAIASPTGSYAGYGFAVPSNIARKVVDDLMKYGTVERGFLGVNIADINAATEEKYKIDATQGVYVIDTQQGGSAAEAGIKGGDIITGIEDQQITSGSQLIAYLFDKNPGEKVTVHVTRDGKNKDFDMTLKSKEGTTKLASNERIEALQPLGADFQNLTKQELKDLGLQGGVKVVQTYPGKLRQQGVQSGFIITEFANHPVKDMEELGKVVAHEKGGVLIQGIYPDHPKDVQYYGVGLS